MIVFCDAGGVRVVEDKKFTSVLLHKLNKLKPFVLTDNDQPTELLKGLLLRLKHSINNRNCTACKLSVPIVCELDHLVANRSFNDGLYLLL